MSVKFNGYIKNTYAQFGHKLCSSSTTIYYYIFICLSLPHLRALSPKNTVLSG